MHRLPFVGTITLVIICALAGGVLHENVNDTQLLGDPQVCIFSLSRSDIRSLFFLPFKIPCAAYSGCHFCLPLFADQCRMYAYQRCVFHKKAQKCEAAKCRATRT